MTIISGLINKKMLKSNVIRKKVLAIVNEKIEEKQKYYEDKVHIIDNECAVDIKVRKEKKVADKAELLYDVVQSIVGKII